MTDLCQHSLNDFTDALASSAPTPGGGAAAALAGAIAAALGGMVCSLTEGKSRYDDRREAFSRIAAELTTLRAQLLSLVDEDARAFAPLSRAYAIPRDDPARPQIMETALHTAAEPPMRMLRACARGTVLTKELIGLSPLPAATDAGCAAVLFGAGLGAAAINLRVNTKDMTDRAYADALERECDDILKQYRPLADKCRDQIMEVLL